MFNEGGWGEAGMFIFSSRDFIDFPMRLGWSLLNYAFSDMNFKRHRGELPEGETRTAAADDYAFEQLDFSNQSVSDTITLVF